MTETVPSYAAKMKKVEAASGVSMEVMIYIVGPTALALSGFAKLLFHATSEPWKIVEGGETGPDNSSSHSQKGK